MKTNLDFILNNVGRGDVAQQLLNTGFQPNLLRPYLDSKDRSCVDIMHNGKFVSHPVQNVSATLRKDDWLQIDKTVLTAARPRLKLVAALRAAGLTYTIPNGMGKTMLQSETMGDVSGATVSMDAVRESQRDRPEFDIQHLPLPIIHKDFSFTARQIEVSRNGGTPLDLSMAEASSRKVAETAEEMALGTWPEFTYGGGKVQGLINFEDRQTYELSDPTDTGWTPSQLVDDLLAMKRLSQLAGFYGPWNMYVSSAWDLKFDADYSTSKGDNTLRERISKIGDISAPVALDYLTGYDIVLVQMTSDVIREVIGMDITTVTWPSKGGLELNFKIMAIMVPQLRGKPGATSALSGIIHGAVV